MKQTTAIILVGLLLVSFYLVSNSNKDYEYKRCMNTSTDKSICESLTK